MSLNLCRIPRRHALHLACTIGLSVALIVGGAVPALTIAPATAHAASAQTLSELRALQSEVSGAASTYAEAMAKANELNEQVSTIADEILHIEEDLLTTFIDILKKNPARKNVMYFFPYSLPFPALYAGAASVR
jgi:hypothetical protein